MIESAPVDQVVLEGSNLTLDCSATGNPTPNITWRKDGSSAVLHQGETYIIVNVTRHAAGDYICTAWNGMGSQKNVTATVHVHCELLYCTYLLKKRPCQCSYTYLHCAKQN